MSRLLSDLLGAREPFFTQHLNRLEAESGHPGVDLRLSSDISKKVGLRLKELGLDPADTNGNELYHGLQNLIAKHDTFLAKKLDVKNPRKTKEVISKVVIAVPKLPIPQTCWAIKHTTAKKLLHKMPPKHVMKQLRFRSVDSLLKRANIDEVFAAIHFAEASSWREKFMAQYRKLTATDFESRKISIIELDHSKWGNVIDKKPELGHKSIIQVNEMGIIAVLPLPVEELPGLTITLLPLIIHRINEIRCQSSYLKLLQVKPDFTNIFTKVIHGNADNNADLFGQPLSWDIIHKHFGKAKAHPEIFTPHVQAEDLAWKLAEDVLYKLEPALKFWEGLDFVGAPFRDRPVSLNLLDNAISFCNNLEYGHQSLNFFRESLRRELYSRYLSLQPFENHITQQFDIAPVEIDVFSLIEEGIV